MAPNLKIYEFFPGSFHAIFSDPGWLQLTETLESETLDKGELPGNRITELYVCICLALIESDQ
jgi:hypothetical protein